MKSYEGGETHNLATRYAHGSLEMTIKGLQSGHKALQSDKLRLYSVESVEGGNSRLILALAKTLGSKLHLNSPLKELRRSANQGFELVFGGTQAQTVRADRVVLTFPCSVYPSIQFGKATLPPERLARIAAIPYGSHAKILIHVPPNAPHTSISTDGLTGWINSEMQHATLFLSGDKGIMTNEQAFLKNLKWGSEIFSQAGIDLNPTRVQVPQTIFSSHSEAVGISWTRDPFIQGSYSYISPATTQEFESNQDHQGETILPLFAPIAGKIFFAGEHTTTEQDIRGTMEAAAASGEQAFRLLTHQLKQDFGAVL